MKIAKIALISTGALAMLFWGCQGTKSGYSDEEMGLRKTTLLNENLKIESYDYSGKSAGESQLIERSFENAPPMISHSTEDMLPITKDSNACLSCHLPDMAAAVNAVPMPKTHFYNFRSNKNLGASMDENRFNCVICHATQVDATPLVQNNFAPNFRKSDGRNKSNLIDVVNEGVR